MTSGAARRLRAVAKTRTKEEKCLGVSEQYRSPMPPEGDAYSVGKYALA